MEAFGNGIDKVMPVSVRQSEPWAEYLRYLKWEVVTTKAGIKVSLLKTFFGTLCKIQRPQPFIAKDLDEIEKLAKQRKVIFIKIEPGYGQEEKVLEMRDYRLSKFPLSPPSTMIIDLTQSEQKLWSNLSKSGKYSVKRARREGCWVKVTRKPKDKQLQKFYKVAKFTGKRGKFYVQPYKDLQKKRDVFKNDSFLAEVYDVEENLASTKFFIGWQGCTTFIMGGTTSEGRKGKGGYELMWQSIRYFKDIGYEYIDLEGVDDDRFPLFTRNWGGFSHFKEKFGGTTYRLPPPYIKYLNPVLKFLSKFQELPL